MKLPNDTRRIQLEYILVPAYGKTFTPTNFPSLGPAEFSTMNENNTKHIKNLIVESSQSLANHFEDTILADNKIDILPLFSTMPHVIVKDQDGNFITNTLIEPHRINSPYVIRSEKIQELMEKHLSDRIINVGNFAKFLAKYDVNSIIHGVFLSQMFSGRYQLGRLLTASIHATDINSVHYKAVKIDRYDPTGKQNGNNGAKGGYGNVLYEKAEYTAGKITMYVDIDVGRLLSYGLSNSLNELIYTIILYKLKKFTNDFISLRSNCVFKVKKQNIIIPKLFKKLPSVKILEKDIQRLLKLCIAKKLCTANPTVVKISTRPKEKDG